MTSRGHRDGHSRDMVCVAMVSDSPYLSAWHLMQILKACFSSVNQDNTRSCRGTWRLHRPGSGYFHPSINLLFVGWENANWIVTCREAHGIALHLLSLRQVKVDKPPLSLYPPDDQSSRNNQRNSQHFYWLLVAFIFIYFADFWLTPVSFFGFIVCFYCSLSGFL